MAKAAGYNSSVTFATTDLGGRNLTLNERILDVDTTEFGDSYDEFITTTKGADVSLNAPFDTARTTAVGDKGWLVTQITTGYYVVGTGDCLTKTRGATVKGEVTMDLTWKYNGSYWSTP